MAAHFPRRRPILLAALLASWLFSYAAPGARSASAATLPFIGQLSLTFHFAGQPLPSATLFGLGSADVNPLGGTHLTQASVSPGIFAGAVADRVPVTDPDVFPIAGFQLTATNGAGVVALGTNGRLSSPLPLQGVMKVCLYGACGASSNIANIDFPLSVVGQGGTYHKAGGTNLTVIGAPWTTGTATLGSVTAQGSAMGPASQASSTAQLGGKLNLVSPIYISTNIAAFAEPPLFARLRLGFDAGTPACGDGFDNDGDGQTDHPADPGCESASDVSEQQSSLVCDDGFDNDGDGLVDLEDPGCESSADPSEISSIACENQVDDDGDGYVDVLDAGCDGPSDPSEDSPALVCDDGLDNDGDGLVDAFADPNCADLLDPDEASACTDGIDNDGDGLVDFAADPGCNGATGYSEQAQCQDGWDNDFDGRIDFDGGASHNGGVPLGPADPQCAQAYQNRERVLCGIGAELVAVIAVLRRWRHRARD